MKPGAYVVHRSWGFGQIKSFDDTTLRLVIDFKGKKAHAMDPAFCVTTMEVLPGQPPAGAQGDRAEEDPGADRRQPGPADRRGPGVLPEQGHDRHRPGDHARPGDRRGEVQEVVGRRPQGRRQGPPGLGPGEEDRVLRAARDPGLGRGRDLRPVQLHPLGPPPDLARRGLRRRLGPQGRPGRPLRRPQGRRRRRQGQQPDRRRRAPLRRRRPRPHRQGGRASTPPPSSPPRPRSSPTCATCRRSPRRSRSSSRATSSS
jgi:hypothetical protein